MHSTMKVMLDEFKRADDIVNQIHTGKKTWSDLFERHTFFTKDHKYYLSVIAASRTKEAHDMFAGLVQSKVRLLVKSIEDGDAGVDVVRPFIKPFDRVHRCQNEYEIDRVVQGNLDYQVKGDAIANGDSNGTEDSNGLHTIYTATFYIGISLAEGKCCIISTHERC
jgi:poly(A) polymerase